MWGVVRYVFLATLTACNLFSWMFAMFSETSKEHFIINHLEMCETPLNEEGTSEPLFLLCCSLYLSIDWHRRHPASNHVVSATHSGNRKQVLCFMDKYLGLDGIFLLRLMAQHADVVFITELIGALWACHYAIEEQRRWVAQPLCRHRRWNTFSPLQCFETNESRSSFNMSRFAGRPNQSWHAKFEKGFRSWRQEGLWILYNFCCNNRNSTSVQPHML